MSTLPVAPVPQLPAAVAPVPIAVQNARIGVKIKAAVFVAVFAAALASPLGQQVVRFIVSDALPEGSMPAPFMIKSALATWAAVVVAAMVFMRDM